MARIARIERIERIGWRGGERVGWRRRAGAGGRTELLWDGQIICLSLVGEVVKGKWLNEVITCWLFRFGGALLGLSTSVPNPLIFFWMRILWIRLRGYPPPQSTFPY